MSNQSTPGKTPAGIPFDLLRALQHTDVTFHEFKTAMALLRLIPGRRMLECRLSLFELSKESGLIRKDVSRALNGVKGIGGLIRKNIITRKGKPQKPVYAINHNFLDWPVSDLFRDIHTKGKVVGNVIDPNAQLIHDDPMALLSIVLPVIGGEAVRVLGFILDAQRKTQTERGPERWLWKVLMFGAHEPTNRSLDKAKELLAGGTGEDEDRGGPAKPLGDVYRDMQTQGGQG